MMNRRFGTPQAEHREPTSTTSGDKSRWLAHEFIRASDTGASAPLASTPWSPGLRQTRRPTFCGSQSAGLPPEARDRPACSGSARPAPGSCIRGCEERAQVIVQHSDAMSRRCRRRWAHRPSAYTAPTLPTLRARDHAQGGGSSSIRKTGGSAFGATYVT